MLTIVDIFTITGRGTAVSIEGYTNLPIRATLAARVHKPDGSVLEARASKEYALRRDGDRAWEVECFLLYDVDKLDVPAGSTLDVTAEGYLAKPDRLMPGGDA